MEGLRIATTIPGRERDPPFRAQRLLSHTVATALVVDLDAAKSRLAELDTAISSEPSYDPGARFYAFDPDGHEFEIVHYAEESAGAAR